ncbi:MAG: helix-turn-helix transcriptional regulator [Hungatella sp.]|nr:helix-turn-helix transcriptional regulator [Hungatella sp.]
MEVNFRLVGRRIHEVRVVQNVSQMQLAELSDLSVSYISMIENAKRKASLVSLVRIANVLGVTVDELLNGNQLYNPTEYQTDIDLLLADCDNYEKRTIYEFVLAAKGILRNNRELLNQFEK